MTREDTLGIMVTRWPAHVVISPMTPTDAVAVSNWRYAGPWRIYDLNGHVPDVIDDYHTIRAQPSGEIVGFFCVGHEARIPGLGADEETVDLGWGMNPAWVGHGHGTAFGATVVEDVLRRHRDAHRIRAVVQSWNTRSIHVLQKLGFTAAGEHTCTQQNRQVRYDVLVLDVPSDETSKHHTAGTAARRR